MTPHRWRTTQTVQAHDPNQGAAVQVVTGLIDTPAGGVQVALQIGDDRPVTLAIQDAHQLATNLIETITERLAITTDKLDDDQDCGS